MLVTSLDQSQPFAHASFIQLFLSAFCTVDSWSYHPDNARQVGATPPAEHPLKTTLTFKHASCGTSLNAPGNQQRADLVKSTVDKLGNIGVGTPYYDPTAFAPVSTARFGTAGFNILRSPGTVNLDMGLFRQFRIKEGVTLQFRAEAFNATNTPHFNAPGNNVSSPSRDAAGNITTNAVTGLPNLNGFMEITSTRSFGREGIDERVFRFGLRLGF